MVKKEISNKRYFGLTKSEVYDHVNQFDSVGGKMNYLNSIIKKSSRLPQKTRESIYEVQAEIYEKNGSLGSSSEAWILAGKPEKAVKILEKKGLYDRVGEIWEKAGNIEKAAEAYEKAEEFDKAGELFEKIGKSEKALKAYEQAILINEKYKSFGIVGDIYQKLKKPEKAIESYRKAAEAYEKAREYYSAAEFWEKVRDYKKAAENWEKATEHSNLDNTKKKIIFDKAANAWAHVGEIGKALEIYKMTNNSVQAAKVLENAGELDKALEFAEESGNIGLLKRLRSKLEDITKKGAEKKVFSFLGLTLFLIGLILSFKEISLTGFAIANVMNNTSHYFFPLFLMIVGILSLGLETKIIENEGIDDSVKDTMEAREIKYKNLDKVLANKDLNPSDLIAVRAVSKGQSNISEDKIYAGPFRPTIHFSLNHLVEGHMYGNWDDKDEVILAPFKELVANNRKSFYGGNSVDVFFVGSTKLPANTVVLKKEEGESSKKFRTRVEDQIQKMGFKVLPGGTHSWGNAGDGGEGRFGNFLQKYNYTPADAYYSIFGQEGASGKVMNILLGNSADRKEKTFEKYYISEIAAREELAPADFGAHVRRNGSIELPSLKRFYKIMKLKGINNFPKFSEWKKERFSEGDIYLGNKQVNSELMRSLYSEYIKKARKEEENLHRSYLKKEKNEMLSSKKILEDEKRNLKKMYQVNGRENYSPSVFDSKLTVANRRYQNDLEAYKSSKKSFVPFEEDRALHENYLPLMDDWNKYWTSKLPKIKKESRKLKEAA